MEMDGQVWEYKAFISYRHRSFDRKVAIQLQKMLETYHIPKQFGKREQWKVFRDETELPVSDDLSADIRCALEKSEFLIVICSNETANSKWCRQEIAYFKELHHNTTKKICAVLIEGNPDTVFPEELRFTEIAQTDADGNRHSFSVEVEPLAANIAAESERLAFKKLKAEFLRIAAPMLGVSYDTLKQRQRNYRYQKITAAAVGAAVIAALFSAYAYQQKTVIARQADQLAEEYTNNLISQSNYYVKEARELLNNNDTVGAVKKLLQALPDRETDRPVVADAVYMLTDVLQLYKTEQDVEDTVTPVKYTDLEYGTWGDYLLDPTGTYLLTDGLDRSGVEVRNAETFEILRTIDLSEKGYLSGLSENVLLTDKMTMICRVGTGVYCFNYLTGETVWENLTVVPENTGVCNLALSGDKKKLVLVMKNKVCLLDADTGSEESTVMYSPMQNPEIKDDPSSERVQEAECGNEISVSMDGNMVAFSTYQWKNEGVYYTYPSYVYIADLLKNSVYAFSDEFLRVEKLLLAEEGQLYILEDTSFNFQYNRELFGFAGSMTIYDYDVKNGQQIWKTSVDNKGESYISELTVRDSPYAAYSGQSVFAAVGSKVLSLNSETGEILQNIQYGDPMVDIEFGEKSIQTIHTNGDCTWYAYNVDEGSGKEYSLELHQFANSLRKAIRKKDVYYILQENDASPSGYSLIRYQTEKADERYQTEAKQKLTDNTFLNYTPLEKGWAYDIREHILYLFNGEKSSLYEIELPEECSDSSLKLLGIDEDGERLYFCPKWFYDQEMAVYVVCPDEQSIEKKTIPLKQNEQFEDLIFAGNTVYYLALSEDDTGIKMSEEGSSLPAKESGQRNVQRQMVLYSWSLKEESAVIIDRVLLEKSEYYLLDSLTISRDGQTISWGLENYVDPEIGDRVQFVQVDIPRKKMHSILPEKLQATGTFISLKSHEVNTAGDLEAVICNVSADDDKEDEVLIFDKTGRMIPAPETADKIAEDIFFSQKDTRLWILYSDNKSNAYTLIAYDTEKQLCEAEISLEGGYFSSEACVEWISDTAFLLYNGSKSYVIDEKYLSTGGIVACIPYCAGYSSEKKDFYVYYADADEVEWGSFPEVSLDDLIRMGEEFLQ